MTDPAVAERIAQWAMEVEVPDDVRAAARLHILDSLGVALGASAFEFADRLVAATRELAPEAGPASVIGRSERFGIRDAALLNGAFMHGLDFDDTYMPGTIHPSASVLPASLAVGERAGSAGRDVLCAYAVGVEVACALGGAVAPGGLVHRGFHPTGVLGAFAAVVAVGRLRRVSPQLAASAQGIVGSMAAGSMEFIETGASVKRLHPGWAAMSAITAVTLAANGLSGPPRVHEGRFGFFATHLSGDDADTLDLDAAVSSLGGPWRLSAVAIKPFPVCHYIHALADAAIALRAEHAFVRDEVRAVICGLHPGQFSLVVDPIEVKRRPDSAYAAQFSAPYVVAAAVARGQFGLDELGDHARSDPAITTLVPLIEFRPDPASKFPAYFSGTVRIELDDGRVLTKRIEVNRGSDRAPMSAAEIDAKFRRNAALARPASPVDEVATLVNRFDELPDVVALMSALRGGIDR